jgi:hypothetical protein
MTGVRGHFDGLIGNSLEGWAIRGSGERPATVLTLIDDTPCGIAKCNAFRADLSVAGIRNGYASFKAVVPKKYRDGQAHQVTIINLTSGEPLIGCPLEITFASDTQSTQSLVRQTSFIHGSQRHFYEKLKRARRVAVLASFSNQQYLLTYQRSLVAALADAGYVVIQVHNEGDRALEECVDSVYGLSCLVCRGNSGHDFGSWAVGIGLVADKWDDVDELILINDSNFGKLGFVLPILDQTKGQFICLTDSYEQCYHAQSYMILFRREALQEGSVLAFFDCYPFPSVKSEVIRQGELGLTRQILASGIDLTPLSPYEQVAGKWLDALPTTVERMRSAFLDLAANRGRRFDERLEVIEAVADSILSGKPLNPSHFFWRTLIADFQHPFVKRELIMKNPANVPDLFLVHTRQEAEHLLVSEELLQYARLEGGSPIVAVGRGHEESQRRKSTAGQDRAATTAAYMTTRSSAATRNISLFSQAGAAVSGVPTQDTL